MHTCTHGMAQRLAAATDAHSQLMGGERRSDRRHLGDCTEASKPQPHLPDCDGPYGPWAAGFGQGDEAAVEQRVTPRGGATEQQVDELHTQIQHVITAFEGGHHVLVCGAAWPGGGASGGGAADLGKRPLVDVRRVGQLGGRGRSFLDRM